MLLHLRSCSDWEVQIAEDEEKNIDSNVNDVGDENLFMYLSEEAFPTGEKFERERAIAAAAQQPVWEKER